MLRVLSLIALLLPVGALAETTHFRINDRMFEVPIEPGFCLPTASEMKRYPMSEFGTEQFRRRVTLLAFQVDCSGLTKFRDGGDSQRIRFRAWGLFHAEPWNDEFSDRAELAFSGLRLLLQKGEGANFQRRFMEFAAQEMDDTRLRFECASFGHGHSSLQFAACLEKKSPDRVFRYILAIAAKPVLERLLIAAEIHLRSPKNIAPRLDIAEDLLLAVRATN